MRIYYSSKFEWEYKRLPEFVQKLAEEKEPIFRNDPFDPRLNTHKLGGRLKGYWAFWLDQKYRIIFEFVEKNTVWFHSMGDHSIYR
jgi:addiction module RelE/StbE family toxin